MEVVYNLKKPVNRRIPKRRVSRLHHWVMIFPTDLSIYGAGYILKGMPYINFFDSFLEDCHKRVYKEYFRESEHRDFLNAYTACLN